MADKTLRELAREYAKGTLGRDAYRKSRTDLLQGILAGEIAVRANDYPPPAAVPRGPAEGRESPQRRNRRGKAAVADAGDDITAVVTDPTRPPIKRAEAERSHPVGMIAAAIGVAILILVAIVMGGRSKPADAPASQTTGTAPQVAAAPEPADQTSLQLIRSFLQKKSWTEPSMQEFTTAWQALTDEQRAAAAGSPEMTRLANAIVKQFQEEQALSALGDSDAAVSKQQRLLAFAQEVGVSDPRLKMPDAPAPQDAEAGAAGDSTVPVTPETPTNGSTG